MLDIYTAADDADAPERFFIETFGPLKSEYGYLIVGEDGLPVPYRWVCHNTLTAAMGRELPPKRRGRGYTKAAHKKGR